MSILVGFAAGKHDTTAVDLALSFARSSGQPLSLVYVIPARWEVPVASDREYNAWHRQRAEEAAAEAEEVLAEHGSDVPSDVRVVEGRSVPRTLVAEAQRCQASMIVVGSGTDARWGHVAISSTADRLLHSSPVPVSVATRGFRCDAVARIGRVTCAFRGDDRSRDVLQRTADLCAEVGADLRAVTFGVRGRTMFPAEVSRAEEMVLEEFVARTSAAQEQALTRLRESGPLERIESDVAVGRNWAEALEAVDWRPDEVLVVGSSSAGFMSRVFLGSSATRIVRHSPVPVVVVP